MEYPLSNNRHEGDGFFYFEKINTGTLVEYVNSADLLGKNMLSKKPFSLFVNMTNKSGFDYSTYFATLFTRESLRLIF